MQQSRQAWEVRGCWKLYQVDDWQLLSALQHEEACSCQTDLVELQHTQLDLLVLVLLLLGLGVGLLLPLLGTTQQTTQNVQGCLLLNSGKSQEVGILQLLAIEDHALVLARHTCKT
jgi:hypothetical protein